MSMKKILMAAAAVTALTAGSANAIAIQTAASTTVVGTKTLAPTGGTVTYDPYTLADELTAPASTTVSATIQSLLTSSLAPSTAYFVTYNITNGTFANTSGDPIAPTNITAKKEDGATDIALSAQSNGTVNSTKAEFIFTTGTGTTTDRVKNLVWATKGIIPTSAKSPVSVTVTIALLSSPTIAIDGGPSAAITLVDFRKSFEFTATAANPQLSIASGFKKFTGDAASASVATAMGVKIAGATTSGGTADVIYKNGTGGALVAADVATAVLTFSGDFTKLDGRLGSAQLADTGSTNVFTANTDNLATLTAAPGAAPTATFNLVAKTTPVVAAESAYTVTPVVTLTNGLTAPTFAAAKLGSVTFEGTSLFVPWVSDGSNGTNNVIRIGNKSATAAVTSVKASLLNPTVAGTSGTVASTATCELGTIAAAGELTINSAALTACFGAFKRSDVRLTVQGGPADLTLKMRSSTAGITTENIVGSGVQDNQGNK
jgi:hypothetical protein